MEKNNAKEVRKKQVKVQSSRGFEGMEATEILRKKKKKLEVSVQSLDKGFRLQHLNCFSAVALFLLQNVASPS